MSTATALLSFKSEIEKTSIYGLAKTFGLPEVIVEDNKPTATIYWEVQPEVRGYGIKSMSAIVTKVVMSVEWSVDIEGLSGTERATLLTYGGEAGKDLITGEIQIDTLLNPTGLNEKKWKVESEVKFEDDGMCIVSDCEVDFNDMTITVL